MTANDAIRAWKINPLFKCEQEKLFTQDCRQTKEENKKR